MAASWPVATARAIVCECVWGGRGGGGGNRHEVVSNPTKFYRLAAKLRDTI